METINLGLNSAPFFTFAWAFRPFFGWTQEQKKFFQPTNETIRFDLGSKALIFLFIFVTFFVFILPSGLFFGPFGAIVWVRGSFKTSLGPTKVDN